MNFEFIHARRGEDLNEDPFRILILADFSGGSAGEARRSLKERKPMAVEVDTLDAVMAKMKPTWISSSGSASGLQFEKLDDFHPDEIFQRFDLFASARDKRQWQSDAKSIPGEEEAVRAKAGTEGKTTGSASHESDADTIGRLMGKPPASRPVSDAAAEIIRRAVAPHIVRAGENEQRALIKSVDAEAGHLMRSVLHDPAFSELEATWRAIDFLIRRVETGETLEICLLDVSKAELMDDLRGSEDLRESNLFKPLVESTVLTQGAKPWAILLGLYSFESSPEEIHLLGKLAMLAQAAGAPFVTGAGSSFIENIFKATASTPVISTQWDELRRRPEAAFLGLGWPRFLLRLPYGRSTEPISAFDFEEFSSPEEKEYLWGHSAIPIGILLAEAFQEEGWEMNLDVNVNLSELPLHSYKKDGASQMTPCGEVWLSDTQVEKLLREGLMAFQSVQGKDEIRLARFQSISEPVSPLAGRWMQR